MQKYLKLEPWIFPPAVTKWYPWDTKSSDMWIPHVYILEYQDSLVNNSCGVSSMTNFVMVVPEKLI